MTKEEFDKKNFQDGEWQEIVILRIKNEALQNQVNEYKEQEKQWTKQYNEIGEQVAELKEFIIEVAEYIPMHIALPESTNKH